MDVGEFGDRWSHHEEEILSVRSRSDERLLPEDDIRVCPKQERAGEREKDWCMFFPDETNFKIVKESLPYIKKIPILKTETSVCS